MLSIVSHQGNANRNHSETPLHTYQNGYNQKDNNKYWQGCGEIGTLVHCLWECEMVQLLWKAVWQLLTWLHMELSYDSAIPLLAIYPREMKTGPHKT